MRPAKELTGVTVMRIEVRAHDEDEAIELADANRLKLLADNLWQVGYSEEGTK